MMGLMWGRTGTREWLLAAMAGVVSTFHVRTVVFGILMTHGSRYSGRVFPVCARCCCFPVASPAGSTSTIAKGRIID